MAVEGHTAAVEFGQVFDDRQSQPEASEYARGRLIRLPKSIEDERREFRGDSHARVDHGHPPRQGTAPGRGRSSDCGNLD